MHSAGMPAPHSLAYFQALFHEGDNKQILWRRLASIFGDNPMAMYNSWSSSSLSVPREPLKSVRSGRRVTIPTTFPFTQLPVELRLKIYRLLLRTPTPILPLLPNFNANATKLKRPSFIPPYAYRMPAERTTFDTSLLYANHAIALEAESVLFRENEFLLILPRQWGIPKGGPRDRNAVVRVAMPHARGLRHMRKLRIEVFVPRSQAGHEREDPARDRLSNIKGVGRPLEAEIGEMVSALNAEGFDGHSLAKLEVWFTNKLPERVPTEVRHRFEELGHWSEYGEDLVNAEGLNEEDMRERKEIYRWRHTTCCWRKYPDRQYSSPQLEVLCRECVKIDQKCLLPLRHLRGIRKVSVRGRVEREFADQLEKAMMSPEQGYEGDWSQFSQVELGKKVFDEVLDECIVDEKDYDSSPEDGRYRLHELQILAV